MSTESLSCVICQKETIFLKASLELAVQVFDGAGLYPSQTAFTDYRIQKELLPVVLGFKCKI